MERMNRDIFPSRELVDAYARLAPFIDNPGIKKAFKRHEFWAAFWKRVFHIGGVLSLLLLSASTIYVGFKLTLNAYYPVSNTLDLAAAAVGLAGLFVQIILIAFKPRSRWLLQRFAAERIRSAKFTLFMYVGRSGSEAEDARFVQAQTARMVADIREEARGGLGALDHFEADRALGEAPAPGPVVDPNLVSQAWSAYETMRLDVQRNHFGSRIRDGEEKARTPATIGDLLFLAAALLSIADASLAGWNIYQPEHAVTLAPVAQAWSYFLIWLLFVLSASMMVFQQARGHAANVARYTQYDMQLSRMPVGAGGLDGDELVRRVHAVERVVLEELGAFLHDHSLRTYVY